MERKLILFCLLFVLFSCSKEKRHIYFNQSYDIDIENFIPFTDRGRITKIHLDKNKIIKLPNTDEYSSNIKDSYHINENFINDDTIYLERTHNYTVDNPTSILKLNNTSQFEILETIDFKSSSKKKLIRACLSPQKDKIVVLFHLPNKKSILEVFNSNAKKTLLRIIVQEKLLLEQQCWSHNENEIVFYDYNGVVHILNINSGKTRKIGISGNKSIWLKGINSIATIKNNNEIVIYSLEKKKILQSIKIKSKFLSPSEILDYYWFVEQKKILVKVRYTLIENLIWNDKELIFDYFNKKSSR